MNPLLFTFKWALIGLGAAALLLVLLVSNDVAPDARARVLAWLASPRPPAGESFAGAVARAAPAVVSITAISHRPRAANPLVDDPLFRRFFGPGQVHGTVRTASSLGSGVIIERSGIVLTNYHVIRGSDAIRVMLADGRVANAEVTGTDPETDLAVLKIELGNLPRIDLADSDSLKVGDVVLAIGNPLGIGQTVTQGIVSATGRNRIGINVYENFIQTDAAINFGNSGGALVDAHGALVGINSARLESDGIGFAIPANVAVDVAKQILTAGRVQRGWLGIQARDLTGTLRDMLGVSDGIVVEAVLAGGPADSAGIRPGDVITHIDGRPIADSHAASEQIAALAPGTDVPIRGVRAKRAYRTRVMVSKRPPPPG